MVDVTDIDKHSSLRILLLPEKRFKVQALLENVNHEGESYGLILKSSILSPNGLLKTRISSWYFRKLFVPRIRTFGHK
jgi:hypothetical protein